MESSNHSFPVEIKELKEDGLSDEPIKFASYTELDKFTHRQSGYIYEVIKRASKASAKENTLSVVLLLNMADGLMARITSSQRSMARR